MSHTIASVCCVRQARQKACRPAPSNWRRVSAPSSLAPNLRQSERYAVLIGAVEQEYATVHAALMALD